MKVNRISKLQSILIEAPIDAIDFDRSQARRDTENYIYADLLFYYSLGDSRPGVITGQLGNGRIRVLTRARFAAVAEDLGLNMIDCILPADTSREELGEFLRETGAQIVDTLSSEDRVDSEPTGAQWHTVSFDREIASDEVVQFERKVNEIFEGVEAQPIKVHRAEYDSNTLYFQVLTRYGRDQAVEFLKVLHQFHQEVASIRSYRGGRFRRAQLTIFNS